MDKTNQKVTRLFIPYSVTVGNVTNSIESEVQEEEEHRIVIP